MPTKAKHKTKVSFQFETRSSFKGFCAVLNHGGNHIALIAPKLHILRIVWKRLTGVALIEADVQNVRIIEE